MAGARNHYEVAFSSLLSQAGGAAICVDESRRPRFDARELKNFDFLVNGPRHVWALDLKGRRVVLFAAHFRSPARIPPPSASRSAVASSISAQQRTRR